MRVEWGKLVAHTLLGMYPSDTTYVFLAGKNYCDPVITELRKCGHKGHISTPMKGLGIGQQLARLSEWAGFGFGRHTLSDGNPDEIQEPEAVTNRVHTSVA